MTPKEKAKELVKRFDNGRPITECAVIAVEFAKEFVTGDFEEALDKFIYLQDIKEEIEKL